MDFRLGFAYSKTRIAVDIDALDRPWNDLEFPEVYPQNTFQ
jgi:hypothetical protein